MPFWGVRAPDVLFTLGEAREPARRAVAFLVFVLAGTRFRALLAPFLVSSAAPFVLIAVDAGVLTMAPGKSDMSSWK